MSRRSGQFSFWMRSISPASQLLLKIKPTVSANGIAKIEAVL